MFYFWHGLAIVLLFGTSFVGGYYVALYKEAIGPIKKEKQ
jgi:hypothetical protein